MEPSDKLVAVELQLQELGKGEEEGAVSHLDVGSALCVCVCARVCVCVCVCACVCACVCVCVCGGGRLV